MNDEPHDRLRKARQKTAFERPVDAARAFGWNVNTYKSHENGNRMLSRQAAERYSRAFGVSLGWLLSGENPPPWEGEGGIEQYHVPMRKVPELTYEQAYNLTDFDKLEAISSIGEYVVVGVEPMLSKKAFTLEVLDESMLPEFKPGEKVTIDPEEEYIPGNYVAAAIEKYGTVVLREYRVISYSDGEPVVRLAALNDAYPSVDLKEDKGRILGKITRHTRIF